MREFFKAELKTLYLKTGLQQYAKLSEMPDSKNQITILLDLLVKECEKFDRIPDEDKKKIILDYMITDPEFQGFNPKIIWKWLNTENKRYIVTQSQYEEINTTPAPPEIAEKYITEWREAMSKIGSVESTRDGIKDHRIQMLKEQLTGIECKHPQESIIEISETEKGCLDCGKKWLKTIPI